MRGLVTGCLVAGALTMWSGAARAQQSSPATAVVSAPTPGHNPLALQPGDVVRLRIWREKDLSGDFPVNERGEAVLPMLGPVAVAGVDPDTLRTRLLTEYGKYLQNPTVDIVLMRRVRILGAVEKPGLYPVDGTMTVADALALAGGSKETGRTDAVEIVRSGKRLQTRVGSDTKLADTQIESGDEIFVPDRKWVSRNPAVVPTLISGAVSLLTMVILLTVK